MVEFKVHQKYSVPQTKLLTSDKASCDRCRRCALPSTISRTRCNSEGYRNSQTGSSKKGLSQERLQDCYGSRVALAPFWPLKLQATHLSNLSSPFPRASTTVFPSCFAPHCCHIRSRSHRPLRRHHRFPPFFRGPCVDPTSSGYRLVCPLHSDFLQSKKQYYEPALSLCSWLSRDPAGDIS